MASIVRPILLRQTCLAAASKRTFCIKAPKSFPTVIRKVSPSTFSNQTALSVFVQERTGSIRVAAFHASGRKAILPAEPQVIQGTVNDAAPVPPASPSHGSYHWTFERLISVALIPLTIAPFAGGSLSPTTDAILCGAVIIHSHIGFQSIVIDYIPNKRLPKTRIFAWWTLRAATLAVAVGLYEFETNDVGVTEAIRRIWTA